MQKYDFGLRGHDIADNFSDMCERANEYKINTLQFALAKTCNDINFDNIGYDEEVSRKIKERLKKTQLNIAVLGCYINPVDVNESSRRIQTERFKNFICYAKDFNADVIGTETGEVCTIEETHSQKNYLDFLNNMTPIVEKAEELNVKIGIEPVWKYTIYSVEMMKKMLNDMKSKNLSVILDISNMITIDNYTTQNSIISEAFDKFGDRISTIHLKDYNIENGKKFFAPTGTGLLNVELIFNNLKSLKKKPQIILDELPLAMYNETVERISKYTDFV